MNKLRWQTILGFGTILLYITFTVYCKIITYEENNKYKKRQIKNTHY